jgi:molecular chaperone GrpE
MKRNKDKKDQEVSVATPEEVEPASTDVASEPAPDVEPTVDDLKAECAALRDQALRAKAEFKNLQRRSATERQQAIRFANADFARDLLVILDDIGRTLDAGEQDTDRATLLKSVEILNDHFRKILNDHQITPIDADQQPFDPARHQALIQLPTADHDPGTVVQVLEAGYMLHDRVLRPAKVAVSVAPPDERKSAVNDDAGEGGSDDDADV